MKQIGILLSGRGSNFRAIAEQIDTGFVPARIAVVVSNRPDAGGLTEAQRRGIPTLSIPSRGVERSAYDQQLIEALRAYPLDLICLAGYMRLLTPSFIAQYRGRILNIHPSLLPAFPGLHAQKQALEHGVKIAGCTVHLVDEDLDAGPILKQAAVPVLDDDTEETLSVRILREEHRIYSEAIKVFLTHKISADGRRLRGVDL